MPPEALHSLCDANSAYSGANSNGFGRIQLLRVSDFPAELNVLVAFTSGRDVIAESRPKLAYCYGFGDG
jgi:hypothetical protein